MRLTWRERWRLLWRGELPPTPPVLPLKRTAPPITPHNPTTLSSWHTADRVAWARETFSSPIGRDMLGLLANLEPPLRLDAYNVTDSSVQTHILYGMRLGISLVRGVIEDLSRTPRSPMDEIAADYGAADLDRDKL